MSRGSLETFPFEIQHKHSSDSYLQFVDAQSYLERQSSITETFLPE